ncbi:hypothetical protein [Methylacidiphilum caldifontis]|uniref:Uncharacterized protein n=1 Tax=Methylacidiphilum caldifontis TaxID=2795386 RepID=A0A4Y8P7U0_9BACT|nr:hypothetical protein [Methylacidiphilum caldifontis]TFE66563.1 hypothetical protein A7Q10_01965 [Methylacidiphilum caldifontis]
MAGILFLLLITLFSFQLSSQDISTLRKHYFSNWLSQKEENPEKRLSTQPVAFEGIEENFRKVSFRIHQVFWIDRWLAIVDEARSTQPYWPAPIITSTARLEQYARYGQLWQTYPGQISAVEYGSSFTGLKLIISHRMDVELETPSFISTTQPELQGMGNMVTRAKYRILSKNQENGNYVLSAAFSVYSPLGHPPASKLTEILEPSIQFGKGWGNFAIQSSLHVGIPVAEETLVGNPITVNTALQYNLFQYFWPTVEFLYTYFPNGNNHAKSQFGVAPEIEFGYIQIPRSRYQLIFGFASEFVLIDIIDHFEKAYYFDFRFYF